ncbi:Radical SAM domain protein [Olavius algarvensis associated proteobacterium Delta 3]|nr:Radical SAM domain protein [Olavius algarvensis associated proteobacterium Delta 3]
MATPPMAAPGKHTAITIRIPDGGIRKPAPRPLVIPIFIPHRGCPHRCSFCNQSAITGAPETGGGSISVRQQVHRFLSHCKPDRSPVEIAFFGGNFLGLSRREVEFFLGEAATVVAAGAADSIRFSTRPDTITESTLGWIRPFPVRTIEVGAQSMVDRVLYLSGRGHREKDTRIAMERIRKYNYAAGVQIMVGLPGESETDARFTGTAVTALEPDFVRIYPTVVVAGSPLAKAYTTGEYRPLRLDEAVARTKILFLMFRSAGIPVIRMGLHVTSDPDLTGAVLAGPIHPAFGHLVWSEIFLDTAAGAIEHYDVAGSRLVLAAHPSNVSRLQGHRCDNLTTLKQRFNLKSVDAVTDSRLEKGEIRIRIAE